jgi:hypothetical protein
MNKLTALAVALLASTAAYAEPYQTNEQFRTNWNTLEEKAHLSRVEHSVLPPTADDLWPRADWVERCDLNEAAIVERSNNYRAPD